MLRWMSGKTRRDKIRNDTFRERVGVAHIVEKLVENRLRLFEHVEKTCRCRSKKSRSDGGESDQKR